MKNYAGVDISKAKFDVHYQGNSHTFTQTPEGYRDVIDWMGRCCINRLYGHGAPYRAIYAILG